MIKAEVVADSVSPRGHRLTTFECVFHRFILPEVNTYRMFSRSASSSRAIPLVKRIEEVRTKPAMPVEWGRNQMGMVAAELLDDATVEECEAVWLEAAAAAADYADYLGTKKVHKQLAARILEPFLWQTMVISSTDFSNMFNQRIHPDAQPEFRVLAIRMKEALDNSKPELVNYNEWHLPFITDEERSQLSLDDQQKVSVARVARTSYGSHGEFNARKDIDLFLRLTEADPPHWAPMEMIATPAETALSGLAGNFTGWQQLRHTI
jgi:thymidylate synthase ThyX